MTMNDEDDDHHAHASRCARALAGSGRHRRVGAGAARSWQRAKLVALVREHAEHRQQCEPQHERERTPT